MNRLCLVINKSIPAGLLGSRLAKPRDFLIRVTWAVSRIDQTGPASGSTTLWPRSFSRLPLRSESTASARTTAQRITGAPRFLRSPLWARFHSRVGHRVVQHLLDCCFLFVESHLFSLVSSPILPWHQDLPSCGSALHSLATPNSAAARLSRLGAVFGAESVVSFWRASSSCSSVLRHTPGSSASLSAAFLGSGRCSPRFSSSLSPRASSIFSRTAHRLQSRLAGGSLCGQGRPPPKKARPDKLSRKRREHLKEEHNCIGRKGEADSTDGSPHSSSPAVPGMCNASTVAEAAGHESPCKRKRCRGRSRGERKRKRSRKETLEANGIRRVKPRAESVASVQKTLAGCDMCQEGAENGQSKEATLFFTKPATEEARSENLALGSRKTTEDLSTHCSATEVELDVRAASSGLQEGLPRHNRTERTLYVQICGAPLTQACLAELRQLRIIAGQASDSQCQLSCGTMQRAWGESPGQCSRKNNGSVLLLQSRESHDLEYVSQLQDPSLTLHEHTEKNLLPGRDVVPASLPFTEGIQFLRAGTTGPQSEQPSDERWERIAEGDPQLERAPRQIHVQTSRPPREDQNTKKPSENTYCSAGPRYPCQDRGQEPSFDSSIDNRDTTDQAHLSIEKQDKRQTGGHHNREAGSGCFNSEARPSLAHSVVSSQAPMRWSRTALGIRTAQSPGCCPRDRRRFVAWLRRRCCFQARRRCSAVRENGKGPAQPPPTIPTQGQVNPEEDYRPQERHLQPRLTAEQQTIQAAGPRSLLRGVPGTSGNCDKHRETSNEVGKSPLFLLLSEPPRSFSGVRVPRQLICHNTRFTGEGGLPHRSLLNALARRDRSGVCSFQAGRRKRGTPHRQFSRMKRPHIQKHHRGRVITNGRPPAPGATKTKSRGGWGACLASHTLARFVLFSSPAFTPAVAGFGTRAGAVAVRLAAECGEKHGLLARLRRQLKKRTRKGTTGASYERCGAIRVTAELFRKVNDWKEQHEVPAGMGYSGREMTEGNDSAGRRDSQVSGEDNTLSRTDMLAEVERQADGARARRVCDIDCSFATGTTPQTGKPVTSGNNDGTPEGEPPPCRTTQQAEQAVAASGTGAADGAAARQRRLFRTLRRKLLKKVLVRNKLAR